MNHQRQLGEVPAAQSGIGTGGYHGFELGALEAKTGVRTERVVDVAATHPDQNTLHAWVYTETPEGVFHPDNPDWGGLHSH